MTASRIRRAQPQDLDQLRALLQRYFSEGDVDVDAAYELERLRAALADPQLGFSVVEGNSELVACVLLHRLGSIPLACECKRLYVIPHARGRGVARHLMHFIEQQARSAGYEWIYLDSKADFTSAIHLYEELGYQNCAPYNDNPQATIFFRKRLT